MVFERFTDRARRVLVLAQQEARLLGHNFIGTEHLLLGLFDESDGVASRALRGFGLTADDVRHRVSQAVGAASSSAEDSVPFTPRSKKVLELSLREALALGHNYIGTEHMLLGLVREGEGVAAQVLVASGADLPAVRRAVLDLLSGSGVDTTEGSAGTPRTADLPPSAPLSDPPRCPRCSAGLAGSARHRTVTVSGGEGDPSAEPLEVTALYCSGCGTSLGILAQP